jgi:hypothetical protein
VAILTNPTKNQWQQHTHDFKRKPSLQDEHQAQMESEDRNWGRPPPWRDLVPRKAGAQQKQTYPSLAGSRTEQDFQRLPQQNLNWKTRAGQRRKIAGAVANEFEKTLGSDTAARAAGETQDRSEKRWRRRKINSGTRGGAVKSSREKAKANPCSWDRWKKISENQNGSKCTALVRTAETKPKINLVSDLLREPKNKLRTWTGEKCSEKWIDRRQKHDLQIQRNQEEKSKITPVTKNKLSIEIKIDSCITTVVITIPLSFDWTKNYS